MNKHIIYPSCAQSFQYFIKSYGETDKRFINKYVTKLLKVRPFDVTLRDSLQSLPIETQLTMNSETKVNLYYTIQQKYKPINMEIGSIVSNKVLPIAPS
jgi:hypothetical protein